MTDVLAYRADIIKRMTVLGTYKPEFVKTIERLAMLYVQQDDIDQQFEDDGSGVVVTHTNKAGAANMAKNPFLVARDEVYAQILAHEKELGLTPAALKRINDAALQPPKKPGGILNALESMERGRK